MPTTPAVTRSTVPSDSHLRGTPLLRVEDLKVSFPSEAGTVDAVRGVSFELHPGRTLGIVGESGSGKSVTALSVMGLLPDSARVSGSIRLLDRELVGLTDRQLSSVRGNDIAMVFQDPLTSLTPVHSIGKQLVEAIQVHQDVGKIRAWERGAELLDLVGIPNPAVLMKSYPHELSGGMRQRVVIALAIANDPQVIIADEPTTALDVTIQAQVLELLKKAQAETGAAVIIVTHDLGLVAGMADDVMVMYAGRPVERATVDELFHHPRMPYTLGLLGAVPRPDDRSGAPLVPIAGHPPLLIDLPDRCPFAARCPVALDKCLDNEPALLEVHAGHGAACVRSNEIVDGAIDGAPVFPLPEIPPGVMANVPREQRNSVLVVEDLTRGFPLTKGAVLKRRIGTVHAVSGVSFDIRAGETLAIVGESGCGKTTTLLSIMDLAKDAGGRIEFEGIDLSTANRRATRELRRRLQIVFQDPMGALDPRFTVSEIISEPIRAFDLAPAREIDGRVAELMDLVGLDPAHVDRFPGAFSGGQRQRIGIARALASEPSLLVLDEPVSALDVSIQAGVINLLERVQHHLGLSYLFVSHDLSVVRHLADRVAVMYLGRFVEYGDVDQVFGSPVHPYTEALLSAVPVPDPAVERSRRRILLSGDLPRPTEQQTGCPFASRCPLKPTLSQEKQQRCTTVSPQLEETADGVDHRYACLHR
ncbi:ABC transporter ATP-binding protein [Kribbella catacumbae]|uniref:dipeptide ABC transporter ATP-binding protein n=1 Tax=Kribbella catacumbae TaxID=460086 RepID=UPI000373B2D6|nr:ABC transporter ATP-binding protein [Kribbella catacumbae]